MNEVYLRDGSRKVKDVLRSKRENGQYCACPPYGYRKDQEDKHRLAPDEQTAPVVQRIFERAARGDSSRKIALDLNADGIIPPLKYRVLYRDEFSQEGAARASDVWNYTTVKRILKNPVYLGHTLLGKSKKVSVKSKKKVPVPRDDWAVTENTHPPLVTKQLYERAQQNLGRGSRDYRAYDQVRKSIFSGIAVCARCGHSLCSCGTVYKGEREKYWYLSCTHQRQDIAEPCTGVRVRYADLLEVVRQRDALQQEVALCQSIAFIRAFHDVTDEFYQRELQETMPRLETLDTQSLSMAIAESPYAAAVDEAFGPQLRRLLTLDQRLHTGGKELQARISQLTAQYQQLVASTKYQVQGETLSGGQLRFALTSTDRERRKAAYDAQQKTAVENGPVMEKLLRELVHARNQLARENGFDSFADYGDLSMQRLGYGRAELDEFCRQVQKYITPLYLQMQEQQRQRLGVETLLPYDRALVFPEGNAVPVATEELPKAARRMYHALSPEAGHFFDEMVRHDLLDVAGSPNKISGMGFCDMLGAPCGMPFIFANCDGTGSDVTVYTHELGHGLQGYLSYRSQPLADYVGLSPDLAEVHSKTMELLTLPYARDFFGPHAPQFLTEHRYDFIKELCAFCSIHTFETWLYEHPDASLSQWAEEFDRTEKVFGRAQNNEPWQQQVLAGCDLFTNTAIYMFPRYVVSYALSIVCAQQLKAAYDADPVDGWARYHALCASGGSKLYAETLAAAGLELPYAPGVVERLARELAAQA